MTYAGLALPSFPRMIRELVVSKGERSFIVPPGRVGSRDHHSGIQGVRRNNPPRARSPHSRTSFRHGSSGRRLCGGSVEASSYLQVAAKPQVAAAGVDRIPATIRYAGMVREVDRAPTTNPTVTVCVESRNGLHRTSW